MAMMMKLRTQAKKVGHIRAREAGVGSCGAFNSKTMMVMRMDITPSLNASIRFVLMHCKCNTDSWEHGTSCTEQGEGILDSWGREPGAWSEERMRGERVNGEKAEVRGQ